MPWSATILLVFTGLLGSVYSSQITSAFPFTDWAGPHGQVLPIAVIFWVCLVAGAGCLVWAQLLREKDRKSSLDSLDRAVAKLEEEIRTTPPAEFLVRWNDFYRLAQLALVVARSKDDKSPAQVTRSCRVILSAVAELARKFDGEPSHRYAANIMIYHPQWPEDETVRRKPRKFANGSRECGVLEVRRELSAVATGHSGEEGGEQADDELSEFLLEVPNPVKVSVDGADRTLWKVLPGAPMAVAKREYSYLKDSSRMARWCEENGSFLPEVMSEITNYFRDGAPRVKSFVSIPLFRYPYGLTDDDTPADAARGAGEPAATKAAAPDRSPPARGSSAASQVDTRFPEGGGDEHGPVVAVLNIHSDGVACLRGGNPEALRQFVLLMEPFGVMLAQLLDPRGV